MFSQSLDAFRMQEKRGYAVRMRPSEWRSGKVIMGARLDRGEEDDKYAGLDLSDNSLSLITKHSSGVGDATQAHHFIIHSRTLILSKDGTVIKF
jgi:hypothetical protein